MSYRFIKAHESEFEVQVMCQGGSRVAGIMLGVGVAKQQLFQSSAALFELVAAKMLSQ